MIEPESIPPYKCEHCSNMVPMKVLYRFSKVESAFVEAIDSDVAEGDVYELLHCPTCKGVILTKYYYHEFDPEKIIRHTIYPSLTKIPLGLPENIKKAYVSSLKVKNIDANAFGVLVGRTLEMVCVDRKAAGKFLGQKLEDLAKKGEIPEKLVYVANNLKDLRNIGAHSSLGELTENEVPILEDLCKAILEYVYSAPYLVDQAQKRLELIKKTQEEL